MRRRRKQTRIYQYYQPWPVFKASASSFHNLSHIYLTGALVDYISKLTWSTKRKLSIRIDISISATNMLMAVLDRTKFAQRGCSHWVFVHETWGNRNVHWPFVLSKLTVSILQFHTNVSALSGKSMAQRWAHALSYPGGFTIEQHSDNNNIPAEVQCWLSHIRHKHGSGIQYIIIKPKQSWQDW